MTGRCSRRPFAIFLAAVFVAAGVALPASSASAGTDDVPVVRVKVRSVTLDGYSGNVVLIGRVRCTQQVEGVGTASWTVTAVQKRRAEAGAPITCDGNRHRALLQLDPLHGRFHPGTVNLTLEQTAVGSSAVEIASTSFSATV